MYRKHYNNCTHTQCESAKLSVFYFIIIFNKLLAQPIFFCIQGQCICFQNLETLVKKLETIPTPGIIVESSCFVCIYIKERIKGWTGNEVSLSVKQGTNFIWPSKNRNVLKVPIFTNYLLAYHCGQLVILFLVLQIFV